MHRTVVVLAAAWLLAGCGSDAESDGFAAPIATASPTAAEAATADTRPIPAAPASSPSSTPASTVAGAATPASTAAVPARWRAMAPAPLAGRIDPAVVWTGEELIVVGGSRDDVAEPGQPAQAATSDGRQLAVTSFVDGAAYDPATDTWRPIAPAPGVAVTNSALWTGDRLLARGSTTARTDGPSEAAVLAYDPAADKWEAFPAPTGADDTLDVTMTWTGRELVLWGHPYRRYEAPPLSVALDPATGTWRPLPPGPLPAGLGPAAAWDGAAVVVVAGQPGTIGPASPVPTPAAALDPVTGSWQTLVPAPTAIPYLQPDLIPAGDVLLLAGGTFADGRNQEVLAFDPDMVKWSSLGRVGGVSRFGERRVWTGRELVEIGGQDLTAASGAVVAFAPASTPPAVLPALPVARSNAGAAWTGSEIIVWGGQPDTDGIGTAMASGVRLALDP